MFNNPVFNNPPFTNPYLSASLHSSSSVSSVSFEVKHENLIARNENANIAFSEFDKIFLDYQGKPHYSPISFDALVAKSPRIPTDSF
jgi:hypothetical protein